MIGYIEKLLLTYDYNGTREFLLSLCPSFRYNIQVPTISISVVLAFVSKYLGLGPVIALAMFVAVVVETVTGIKASKKEGKPFESFKFSRCVLKVFVWISLVFIVNSFGLECQDAHGWVYALGATFFDITKLMVLVYFVIEYLISIMENLAVIDGKPKTHFTDTITSMWDSLSEIVKNKLIR